MNGPHDICTYRLSKDRPGSIKPQITRKIIKIDYHHKTKTNTNLNDHSSYLGPRKTIFNHNPGWTVKTPRKTLFKLISENKGGNVLHSVQKEGRGVR